MRVCSEGGRAEVQGCARVLCRNPQARVAGKSTPALRDEGSQRALQYAKGLSKHANSRASGWRTKCRTQRMRASKLTLSLLFALLTPACQASLGSSDAGMRTDARGTDAMVSLSDAPGVDAPGVDAPGVDATVAAEDAFIPPGTDAYIPACTANCAGRVCGDDGCGGSCGSCAGTCTAAGLCEPPPDVCPRSDALGGHVFPSTWREGQCLFIWNRSDLPESGRPVIRAHFDGSALCQRALRGWPRGVRRGGSSRQYGPAGGAEFQLLPHTAFGWHLRSLFAPDLRGHSLARELPGALRVGLRWLPRSGPTGASARGQRRNDLDRSSAR